MAGEIEAYRDAIVRTFPELRDSTLTLLTEGWDSVAVDVDGRLIFKFPRDPEAMRALVREQAILTRVRPLLSMRVPQLTLHEGPPLFSRHEKIPGDHLLAEDYARLPEASRQRLAASMAEFYAQLHAIDPAVFDNLPEVKFDPQPTPDEIAADLAPVLPAELRTFADTTIAAWRNLSPDPHGEVFSFFDGHGWNMAFDHEAGVLNGIFDFADARIAPLQQDFVYSNFISRDLTLRIIGAYEKLTGRQIDRERVDLLFSVLLLSELAGHEAYPEKLPQLVAMLRAWVAALPGG